jgi:hypothetical protein
VARYKKIPTKIVIFLHNNVKLSKKEIKNIISAQCCWLTPVILATQKAEIMRITVPSQPWTNSS